MFGTTFGIAYLATRGGSKTQTKPTTVLEAKQTVPISAGSSCVLSIFINMQDELLIIHLLVFNLSGLLENREEEKLCVFTYLDIVSFLTICLDLASSTSSGKLRKRIQRPIKELNAIDLEGAALEDTRAGTEGTHTTLSN